MKIRSTQQTAVLISILFCLNSFWIASARTINVTQAPYNASTTLADNGPAIQSALNQLISEGGGTLYIPAGNWQFTTPILLTNVSSSQPGALIIRGDGAHQRGWTGGTDLIFKKRDGVSDAFTYHWDYWNHPNNVLPRLFIRDLAIDGGTQAEVAGYQSLGNHYGLMLECAFYCNISGVTVTGFSAAGIVIDNAYWGSFRDLDVAYCGIGIDDDAGNACARRNISVHNCTTGMHNPEAIIGAAVEGNYGNGLVYDAGVTFPYDGTTYATGECALLDCYFSNNNAADTVEGTDIFVNTNNPSNSPIFVGLNGNCTFLGATLGEGSRTNPYRRIEGNPRYVTRVGATRFTPLTSHALLDIPHGVTQIFIDASTQKNASDVSWTVSDSSNIFFWDYALQTSFTVKP